MCLENQFLVFHTKKTLVREVHAADVRYHLDCWLGVTKIQASWSSAIVMKKVNKQCLLDTPRTVRVSEKTWQVIVRTRRP